MDAGSEECGQFGSTLRERSGQTSGESLRNQEGSYTSDTTLNTTTDIETTVTTVDTNTTAIVATTTDSYFFYYSR